MAVIPQKIQARISEGLKKFQPIVESAKIRDVSESDTVVMLTGILSDILGYDKYVDITTELAIRGTYCDLALKINDKLSLLIEAKAVGIDLKEQHVKQVVDYAANKGIEWVILTNSVSWRVYKIIFSKPIQNILVCDIDFLKLRPKATQDIETIFLLCKEAVAKNSLEEYFTQKQATNKFMIGNLLSEESVLNTIKKELKQIYPDIKVTNDEIRTVLVSDVIKREILEGESSDEAKKKIAKANKRKEKLKDKKPAGSVAPQMAQETIPTAENTIVSEN
ncbi:MAG: type I restriction enzyme HsdR N-terminal domain-containing protein [Bacteroidota bacterium]